MILDARRRGRREHRHLRANKGGGARRAPRSRRAISNGYGKALRTIIDANVVTIGVAFILFTLATSGVKGFAFTLRHRHDRLAVHRGARHLGDPRRDEPHARSCAPPLGARRGTKERIRWHFDFVGNSKWFFSMSGVILVLGALAIAGLGLNFGIDFESGTRIKTPLAAERPASTRCATRCAPLGYGDAKIQKVDEPELGNNVFQISTQDARAGRGQREVQQRARPAVRRRAGRLLGRLDRADLRRPDREHGADRDHRVAAADLASTSRSDSSSSSPCRC